MSHPQLQHRMLSPTAWPQSRFCPA
jgi:hypothetical protein